MELVAGGQRPSVAGAPSWVTVQVPKARRCLCSAHTQAVQVTGTGPICMRAHENGASFPWARVTEEARELRLDGTGSGGPRVRLGAGTCDKGGAGAASGHAVCSDVRALALPYKHTCSMLMIMSFNT
jgi:hypothetical protein